MAHHVVISLVVFTLDCVFAHVLFDCLFWQMTGRWFAVFLTQLELFGSFFVACLSETAMTVNASVASCSFLQRTALIVKANLRCFSSLYSGT